MPKLVCISDTHNQLDKVELPDGDILVHTGDWLSRGNRSEFVEFINHIELISDKYDHMIFIPGNHDWIAQKDPEYVKGMFSGIKNLHYLNDSGVEIDGIKFWGSPITPTFFNWAFNRDRGPSIKKHWDLIPSDTQVLLTHGPPTGILDKVNNRWSMNNGEHVGCQDLMDRINQLKQLKLHVFGHIHSEHNSAFINGVNFINASICDEAYNPSNKPFEITI